MNTFWKVLLLVVAGLLCLHFLPLLFGLAILGFAGLLAVGAVLAGGLAGVLAILLLLLAVLAPVWIPVLAIVGVVALCRGGRKAAA